jgi:methylthioribulose-1-phosphate dehydratase
VNVSPPGLGDLKQEFCQAIAALYQRGWAMGTGGNFSCRLPGPDSDLLMAPSGVDKGTVTPEQLIQVNPQGQVVRGNGRASAETLLHRALVETQAAGAVFHTHSVLNTVLSERYAPEGQLVIQGYEMLKGFRGITTHDCAVAIPIFANAQEMDRLSQQVRQRLTTPAPVPGFLVAGHGLYAWGDTIAEAKRHVEIFEFLLEVIYRKLTLQALPY